MTYGQKVLGGLISIAEGLCVVVTLGRVSPGWRFDYAVWITHRRLKEDRS